MSAELLRDENGNVDGAIAIIRDVDYRKQIELSREKQIQRTEALYRFSQSIAEAGNDLNRIMNLVVKFAAELIGDLCFVSLLKTGKSYAPNYTKWNISSEKRQTKEMLLCKNAFFRCSVTMLKNDTTNCLSNIRNYFKKSPNN